MVRAVVHGHLDVDHREAGEHAVLHGLLHALVDGGDEVPWHVAAHDLVHELVAGAGVRLHAQPAVTVLAGTAGLLLVAALGARNAADGLSVRDGELHGVGRYAGALLKTVQKDGDLRFSDGGYDGLPGFLVAGHGDRGVGVRGLLQERVDLALAATRVRLDGDAVQGVREAELRRLDLARDGERVAGHGVQLRHHAHVARRNGLHVLHVVAAHLVQVAQALALAGARVDELGAGRDGAREHLHERELAVLLVLQRLEHEGHRAVVVRRYVELLAVHQWHATVVRHGREPLRHVAHERYDALLAHAGACEHGDDHAVGDGLAQQPLELLLGDLLAVEVLHHQLVVGLDRKLHQLRVRGLGGLLQVCRDVLHHGLSVHKVARLHVHDVDYAAKRLSGAHGHRHGHKAVAITVLGGQERGVPVGVGPVKTVDEERAGDVQVLGRKPQARGDGAGARRGVHHEDCRLRGGERSVRVTHEVRVARRVEHVDPRALPLYRGDRSGDGKTALAFLAVVVKRGLGAGVSTQAGRLARKVEHGLGQHGLAHAALAHECEVLHFPSACSHGSSSSRIMRRPRRSRNGEPPRYNEPRIKRRGITIPISNGMPSDSSGKRRLPLRGRYQA